jgi:hypothetical protein
MASFFRARIWNPYVVFLDKRPMLAKMVTASVLMSIGDMVAQEIERSQGKRKHMEELKTNTTLAKYQFQYDYIRTLRMASIGFVLTGPLLHQW